jgi:DNA (cytosine-5)-methyltransferase 1
LRGNPRLLDLFCGAGGAAKGYAAAGFDVTGVDIKPQPHYPYTFVQADAMTFPLDGYDVIHASPPCQAYSRAAAQWRQRSRHYTDFIGGVREKLAASGIPYVIENVPSAPLRNAVELCGTMFGLPLYRHRLFEASFVIRVPFHPGHAVPCSPPGHWQPGTFVSVAGNCAPIELCRHAMGIDWMNRDELAEAIPPVYTRHVGMAAMECRPVPVQAGLW